MLINWLRGVQLSVQSSFQNKQDGGKVFQQTEMLQMN